MFLTDEEITTITKRVHHKRQAEALVRMGIMYKTRPDGSLLVSRSHVEQMLGGEVFSKHKAPLSKAESEPNWAAMGW